MEEEDFTKRQERKKKRVKNLDKRINRISASLGANLAALDEATKTEGKSEELVKKYTKIGEAISNPIDVNDINAKGVEDIP